MNGKKIGIIGASAIVASNIMGSGISLLPASLAAVGSIVLISWLIALLGALALAYVFSRLGVIDPREGGPVAYAKEVSSILGHQTGLLYWVANWVGNLAIAITAIEYLSYFFPALKDPIVGGMFVICSVWLFTFINFLGASKIAKIVLVTLVLLLIPVFGTGLFGWFHFSKAQFIQNWNVSEGSDAHAIFSGIVLTIWSFIGIESASVSAGLVKNPKVTIPVATMIGTTLAGLMYIASTTAISGMFPAKEIADSGEPFGVAFGAIVGNWVQPFVSIFTAVACFASMGSWMMLVGQAGMVAARQGALPEIFKEENAKGIPVKGLTITSVLMTILMIILMIHDHFDHESSTQMFSYIILTAVVVTIIPYFYSCLHMIHIDSKGPHSMIRMAIVLAACVFCFTAILGSQQSELAGTFIASLTCFVFYCFHQRAKGTGRETYSNDTPWR